VTEDKSGMAHYLVRDKKNLIEIIIPIFEKYKLLTSKEYSYNQFKKCLAIAENTLLTLEERINLIKKEKSYFCPETYIPSK